MAKKKVKEEVKNDFYFENLTDIIKFGLYRNNPKTVEEIMKEDPGFIDWCIKNFEQFKLSKPLLKEFEKIKNK